MKYLISLVFGLLVGATLFVAGVLYNPFLSTQVMSPLSVTDARTITLTYSGVASDSIVFTNDGSSRRDPFPEDVLQLWEKPIRQTEMFATVLNDARNNVAGLGIKMSSLSERTQPLKGEALVDSVWYIYLPGRGSLFIEQSENYWGFIRDVVVPAYRASSDVWRGNWLGNMTAGPGSLRTARVVGGSGEFAGIQMYGLETLIFKAWSVEDGPAAANGRLMVELADTFDDQSDSDIAATN